MAFLRMIVSSGALIGLAAASVEAQSTRAHVIVAPQGRPRIASIAPPPPPPRTFYSYGQTVFQNPVIVTADGRVLVDLGNGYEQVASTPTATYPPAGAYGYYPTPPQAGSMPAARMPTNSYGGCLWGNVAGSYSQCIEPSRSPVRSASAVPSASGKQPSPRPPAGRPAAAPRVIHR